MKIIICGIGGKMGNTVLSCALNYPNTEIAFGVDKHNTKSYDFPVFATFEDANIKGDVIIDFSRPEALEDILDYSIKNNTPVVLATTGYTDNQLNLIEQASKKVPIFSSGNMSLGIAVMRSLVKQAASKLAGFDIEIVEAHHNQKVDAPSGTAIMLAQSVNEGLPSPKHLTFGRHSYNQKRTSDEIGMHSIRGGTVVGEHTVSFFGTDEIISISHSAGSKSIFALGALKAAHFLANQKNGLYNMNDLLKDI